MDSVLISGANRGIGLEFARQYAADGWQVHATARSLEDAAGLQALGQSVFIHRLNVTDKRSIDELARTLGRAPIDLLIANAGIPGDLARPVERIDRTEIIDVMAVNSFGPLALAAALLPNLRQGKRKIAIAISSLMGSIAMNDFGTQYVYRASKTALNALWTSLALEWHDIICVLLRLGLVRTRMTNFKGDLEPGESVAGMRWVIAGLSLADSGRLIGYDVRTSLVNRIIERTLA
jgi:NAD(P)-dependent dehydrogenase (short-subunit alcohol dehydrogenase family)